MKKLILFSGVLLVALFLSCQEIFLNQPETPSAAEISKPYQVSDDIYVNYPVKKGEINLCSGILNPLTEDCKVNGKVTYTHSILNNSGEILKIKVGLELNAELCNKLANPMKYSIYGNSVDTVSVNEEEKLLLDKSYGILYRLDLKLCVQFLITPQSIEIMQLNLLRIVN